MKNKKGNVAVIAIIIVIMAITVGVVSWLLASKNQISQSTVSTPQKVSEPDVVKEPIKEEATTPVLETQQQVQSVSSASVPSCGKLSRYKNEPWASSYGAPGEFNAVLEACVAGNIFLINNGGSEFGCERIRKYEIENNKLNNAQVMWEPDSLCVDHFEKITNDYVEYFGSVGDGGEGMEYHGRYYFKEDRVENISQTKYRM